MGTSGRIEERVSLNLAGCAVARRTWRERGEEGEEFSRMIPAAARMLHKRMMREEGGPTAEWGSRRYL